MLLAERLTPRPHNTGPPESACRGQRGEARTDGVVVPKVMAPHWPSQRRVAARRGFPAAATARFNLVRMAAVNGRQSQCFACASCHLRRCAGVARSGIRCFVCHFALIGMMGVPNSQWVAFYRQRTSTIDSSIVMRPRSGPPVAATPLR